MNHSETKFTLIEDTREQQPLTFTRESIRKKLDTADYSIEGYEDKICFERKSIKDLIGTCDHKNRERFKRELARMRDFQFYAIVISGTRESVLLECENMHKIQMREFIRKFQDGIKCRQPKNPRVRASGVFGSLRSWRSNFNAHYYFFESEEKVANWIELQCEYFMYNKAREIK